LNGKPFYWSTPWPTPETREQYGEPAAKKNLKDIRINQKRSGTELKIVRW